MKKIDLILLFVVLFLLVINCHSLKADSNIEVSANKVLLKLSDENISFDTVKGFSFDFNPIDEISYSIEITDTLGNIWTTDGNVDGINGDKGSGVLTRKNAPASTPLYTNVFDDIEAGNYNIYIPFDFYTGKTGKNNQVINALFKIQGFDTKEGISIGDVTYDIPTEILGTIKFVLESSAQATNFAAYLKNVSIVTDDSIYKHYQLNIADSVKEAALTGYNELGTRATVEFTQQNTIVKWNAATSMANTAGFLLKMGNTGKNDIKIRFAISENGQKASYGIDCMTESYSGAEVDENEYYRFIHMENSVKPAGREEKLYITKRKVTIPAGYQGILLLPFSRLRFQADGYIPSDQVTYYNGRLDGLLGSLRLYVDNISEEAALENSLTFYVLNAIKASDGLGVSYKVINNTDSSKKSSIAVEENQAILSQTPPTAVNVINDSTNKTESLVLTTPNASPNETKLYMNQTATITVSNLVAGLNYDGILTYEKAGVTYDISDELDVKIEEESITYSFRKILQSRGNLTFKLANTYTVKVSADGKVIESKKVNYGSSYSILKADLEKENYSIKSVKCNGVELSLTDGSYVISNILENKNVEVTYEINTYTVTINKDDNCTYQADGNLVMTYADALTITVSPANGYKIDKVLVNGTEVSLTNGKYTFSNVSEDKLVTIETKIISYSIIVTVEGNGKYELDRNTLDINNNEYVLTLIPDANNIVRKLVVNGDEVDVNNNSYKGSILDQDIKIIATFEVKTYKVSIEEPDHGEIKVSNTKISHGSRLKITVTPDDGYELDILYVNGEEVDVEDGISYVENVTSSISIYAEFKEIKKASSGCLASLSLSLVAALTVLGFAVVLLKKKIIGE